MISAHITLSPEWEHKGIFSFSAIPQEGDHVRLGELQYFEVRKVLHVPAPPGEAPEYDIEGYPWRRPFVQIIVTRQGDKKLVDDLTRSL